MTYLEDTTCAKLYSDNFIGAWFIYSIYCKVNEWYEIKNMIYGTMRYRIKFWYHLHEALLNYIIYEN